MVEELGKEQDIKQSRRKMEEVVPAQVATTQIAIPEVVLVVVSIYVHIFKTNNTGRCYARSI